MTHVSKPSRFAPGAAFLLGLAALQGCGGSGSSSGTAFAVESISVTSGTTWQINRPIDFKFTAPVDFSTVNLNTISIRQVNGAPAVGSFSLDPQDPSLVRFQPACPTEADFSDAGLQPGATGAPVTYEINVVGGQGTTNTVRSISGSSLSQGQSMQFDTPTSTQLADLFIDTGLGAPSPLIQLVPEQTAASYIELGLDDSERVYFQPRATPDPDLGADVPAGFEAPLNLYSDLSTRVAILIAVNQAVDPSAENLSPSIVRLEYLAAPGAWTPLPHEVELVENCTETGALLRLTPLGVMPQGRQVRIVLAAVFRDVVGQANPVPTTVGTFLVDTAIDPSTGNPGESDEILEDFVLSATTSEQSLEDEAASFQEPKAVWADNGRLEAAFGFEGTGGPEGAFDWTVPTPSFTLDTSFAVIQNATQSMTQTVINGRVDIRNLVVPTGATLTIEGPNACTILVSGSATINGTILCRGFNNKGVATLNTTNLPEAGAAGNCGGGRGGAGSFLTTQSTPAGEDGYGAFNVAGFGGRGGEATYNGSTDDNLRRGAGGGGGTLGKDTLRPVGAVAPGVSYQANPNNCPDQTVIGLDAEDGNPGWPTGTGPLPPFGPAAGGAKGPRPFFDAASDNDFWGTMRVAGTGQVIQGELLQPWAGAGGGGGGDAIFSVSFPTTPFNPAGDEKGAGGGGGGGSLTILALGPITFGVAGRIDVKGGTGGGGENSIAGGITRIGGGSGGASAGHLVIQSATRIDLSATRSTSNGGLYALGGQGGAGANNAGGSTSNGNQTTPQLDVLPHLPSSMSAYPATSATSAPCVMHTGVGYAATNSVGNANASNNGNTLGIVGAGGDGGPGIIQLHVPTLADIIVPPAAQETLWRIIKPPPIGAAANTGINTPAAWSQMLPIFGRVSKAQSKWIPLGAANVPPPPASGLAPVQFVFDGADPVTGEVETVGSGTTRTVAELPAVLSGTIQAEPALPFLAADDRTVVFDGSSLDPIYQRNAQLMRRYLLRITPSGGGTAQNFEIASAVFDSGVTPPQLRATVSASGLPFDPFGPGATVEVRPRFFRVETDGLFESLPASSTIAFEFQAAPENAQSGPDEAAASLWVKDLASLSSPTYRFVRFRVTFDILADGSTLSFDTPIPALEFFRIPFKF